MVDGPDYRQGLDTPEGVAAARERLARTRARQQAYGDHDRRQLDYERGVKERTEAARRGVEAKAAAGTLRGLDDYGRSEQAIQADASRRAAMRERI